MPLNILLLMMISFIPRRRLSLSFAHTNTDRHAAALFYGITVSRQYEAAFVVCAEHRRRDLDHVQPGT